MYDDLRDDESASKRLRTIIDSLESVCRHLLDVVGDFGLFIYLFIFCLFVLLTCGLQDVRGCGTT